MEAKSLGPHIVPQQYPHSYAIHNVKSRISGEDQPHCHLMFSLKADDGIERSAEQYFKRYNPQDPAKGGAKKIQLQDGVLGILPPYIAKPSEAPVCRGL